MIQRTKEILGIFGFVLAGIGGLGFVARICIKVFSGRGLDEYMSGWGIIWNYMGAFVLMIAAGVALVVAFVHKRFSKMD